MNAACVRVEDILGNAAQRLPNHAAVVDACGALSYQELADAAARVRDGALKAGVAAGSVVGISLVRARDFLAALFGAISAQCIVIPIAPNLAAAERSRLIQETGVSWLIEGVSAGAEGANGGIGDMIGGTVLRLLQLRRSGASIVFNKFPDAAVIRYTSGTTAYAKGVVLSHRAVLERTEVAARLLGVGEYDVVLTPLSLSYHFVASALSCVRMGATLLDCVDLAPSEVLALGVRHGATMIYGSPIQYELLTRAAEGRSVPQLRRAISTAALLSQETAASFAEAFGVRLAQVYGVIEVGLPLWNDRESFQASSLGVCRAPYECVVVSDAGDAVKVGEVGELLLRGPGSFSGYVIDAAAARHSGDGWFATGDLVTCGADGALTYRGRKKSVINCGGHKVFPEEVEAVLLRIQGIRAARVSAEPHPVLGNLVIAEVVVDPRQPATVVQEWRARCYRELSPYKVPKDLRIVPALPTTGSGKVVRHNLTVRDEELVSQ